MRRPIAQLCIAFALAVPAPAGAQMSAGSAPGWYTGGSPFDAMPSLLAWDRVS